jgi:hypothetical protein
MFPLLLATPNHTMRRPKSAVSANRMQITKLGTPWNDITLVKKGN